jgi:predicted TIM-barrel fold metal-dependent hydrolase
MIIEWNAHMFSSDTERYPFHEQAVYVPDASRWNPDPLDVYLERMKADGIDCAVLVHPEPYGDDHRLILDCLERQQDRLVGTSLFYPTDTDAPRKLEDLVARQPRIISTRFHAHRGKEQYLDSFDDPGVVALWKKAVDLGLIIELHIGPNYAAQASARIRDYPETPVLIDHLAEPHMGDAVEYADVLAMADLGNVYMKLSGLGHFASDEPLFESATTFTTRVIEAYGPARTVWGGGPPAIVDAHMPRHSEADRALVRGGNLSALLGPRWFADRVQG